MHHILAKVLVQKVFVPGLFLLLVSVKPFALNAVEQKRVRRFARCLAMHQAKLHIPGMSAALVKDGRLVWKKGYGYRNAARKLPATPRTQYAVASLTKGFSSILMLKLVREGRLSLDTPMHTYLPKSFPGKTIRVRHVLSHVVDGPGYRFNYRADLFRKLTVVIRKAAGMSYADYLEKTILAPLDMKHSVAGYDNPLAERRIEEPSACYSVNSRGRRKRNSLSKFRRRIFASFGLVSSVEDLALYAAALDRGTLLDDDWLSALWEPYPSDNTGTSLPYGKGWFVSRAYGEQVAWHYGLLYGTFSSLIVRLPEQRLTFILLANSDGLSTPFALHGGNLFRSPLAVCFLRYFVAEKRLKDDLPPLPATDALPKLKRFVENRKKEQPRYLYSLELFTRAVYLRYQGKQRAAEAMMAYALQVDPRAPFMYDRFNIAGFARAKSLYLQHAAWTICDNLLKRDPHDPRVLYKKARLYWQDDKKKQAVSHFQEVLEYDRYGGYQNLRAGSGYYLGLFYRKNNPALAKRYLRKGLASGGGSASLRRRMKRMLR